MTEGARRMVTLLMIVTPDFNQAATVGFLDPFRAVNYLGGRGMYRWTLASVSGGTIRASNGLSMQTVPLAQVAEEDFGIVALSSSWAPETHNSKPLHTALRHWARGRAMLVGLDTGAFILAEAGLLGSRRATVHYEHIDAFAELYPDTATTEDLFVIDGNRITCCGGVAAIDLALHIIRTDLGDAHANAAARYIFHPSLRPAGAPQNPTSAEPLGSTAPAFVRRAIQMMEQNLEEPLPIPRICAHVGVSQRHLDRLFAAHVGRSPTLYYRDIRLDRARGLVTQTDLAMSEIAIASGFASPVHFSRAYRERFGLPPRSDRIEGRVPFEFRAWPMHRKPG